MRPGVVLLTGASGFVGSHLSVALAAQGHQVHGVRIVANPLPIKPDLSAVQFHTVSNNDLRAELTRVLEGVRPDVVIHLASLFIAEHAASDLAAMLQANLVYGSQLLESMLRTGVRKFINTGTSWQQFSSPGYHPTCLYAAQKQAFEDVVDYYVEAEGFSAVTLRLYDTYGPFDHRAKLFYALRRAASGHRLALSPGDQKLDLVHIDDVADAYLGEVDRLLSGAAAEHPRFGLYARQQYTLKEVIQIWEHQVGRKLEVAFGERTYRRREIMIPVREIVRPPHWSPRWDLAEGIANTLHLDPVSA